MADYRSLKEEAWEANRSLQEHGLVVHTFGNVSAFDRFRGVLAIKPSGVPYESLKPEDMVVVDLDGKVADGEFKPSSDTPTHRVLYRHFDWIGGIAHTHSTYATAWAQARRAIPVMGTTHADFLPGDIPCVPPPDEQETGSDYEAATGRQITAAYRQRAAREYPMTLVAGHGPFTWGANAAESVHFAVILEELARMASLTLLINPDAPRLESYLVHKHYERKHGRDAYYGQDIKPKEE